MMSFLDGCIKDIYTSRHTNLSYSISEQKKYAIIYQLIPLHDTFTRKLREFIASFMPYTLFATVSITLLLSIHIFAGKLFKFSSRGKLLSAGGGVAISYIFIDLLPKLSISDELIRQSLSNIFPYFEKHAYIMALAGFLLFFIVDRLSHEVHNQASFWLSLSAYGLFNFLIGYSIISKDPEVQPLILFTIAIGLHFLTNDYSLRKEHGTDYSNVGKWILAGSLLAGWVLGVFVVLPKAAFAPLSAFIGGGVIMNVIRHEMPKENPKDLISFVLAALFYMILLLAIGY